MGEEQYALLTTEPLTSTSVSLFHHKKIKYSYSKFSFTNTAF